MNRLGMTDDLAPVQRAMLRARGGGRWMEQILLDLHPVEPVTVSAAWRATVAAVEALRLGFRFGTGGDVLGWVERETLPEVVETWIDERWLEQDRRRDFDWESGVPWRVAFDGNAARFCWTVHHGLFDGGSMMRVMSGFLEHLAGGRMPSLKLARWQTAETCVYEEAAEVWREAFGGVTAVEWLMESGEAGRVSRDGGECLVSLLDRRATEWGVTVATLVSWAWAQVVACEAGVSRVAVGQVRRGAPQPDAAGFTMNTLPLVIARAAGGSLVDELGEVRRQILALRRFEQIAVERLDDGVFGDAGVPWSSVLMVERGALNLQLGGGENGLLKQAELREMSEGDLTAAAYLFPAMKLEIEVSGRIGKGRAERMLEHWLAILERLAKGEVDRAAEAGAIPVAWRRKLEAWESGGRGWTGSGDLGVEWQRAAVEHANEVAVVWRDGEWSYRELAWRAESLASRLREEGVETGDRVGVHMGRREMFPLALLACARIGAVYVPLDRRMPAACRVDLLEDARLRVVLDDDGVLAREHGLAWLAVDEVERGFSCGEAGDVTTGECVALLYTSGSTAKPKGVMLGHAGLLNEQRAIAGLLGLGCGSRMMQFSAPGFDASLEEMLSCFLNGATLVMRSDEAAEDLEVFEREVVERRVDVLNLPTAFWAAWCGWMRERGGMIPEVVRAAVIGGERLAGSAMEDWRAVGGSKCLLLNAYGPTEATVAATCLRIDHGWSGEGDPPIGRPLPGYRVSVRDAFGERVAPGAPGEVWIGGFGVGLGYWRRDDEMSAAFVWHEGERWYRTGDVAKWDGSGDLIFGGRLDDQLKIRGHRIEPEAVSKLLEAHEFVSRAHVAGIKRRAGKTLAAWVRGKAGEKVKMTELRSWLSERLPAASVPTHWAEVEAFPLTERGKVDRRRLPAPRVGERVKYDPPRTATERRLAELWVELLGCDRAGRVDDFFALGGSSLVALKLFSRCASEFGVRLPLGELVQSPRLSDLATLLDESRGKGESELAPVMEIKAGEVPLYCIHGGDGGVLFYRKMAANLPKSVGLYALESPLLGAERMRTPESVEVLAADYVKALRHRQKQGPYRLAGYSFGGLMAYEMARQLLAMGEEVAFVGLFDTANPAMALRKYSWSERMRVFYRSVGHLPWRRRAMPMLRRVCGGVWTNLRVKAELVMICCAGETGPHDALRMLTVREHHTALRGAYQPKRLEAELVLFKVAAVDDKFRVAHDYGWSSLVSKLRIVDVEGDHLTMFDPPFATVLAAKVGARVMEEQRDTCQTRQKIGR